MAHVKTVIAALVFVLASSYANADEWGRADTVREGVFIVTMVADWAKTRDIARHPGFYETNEILGRHPSNSSINTYFASMIAGHVVVAYLLPQGAREAFQYGGIAIELNVVASNKSLGLKFAF